MSLGVGEIVWISGPVVKANNMGKASMYELVEVGSERLIGEVIRVEGETATIQVYENTSGLRPGEPVYRTGMPLTVELGPGIIGNIYDGIQRPLEIIKSVSGIFVTRGIKVPSIPRDKKWYFKPSVKPGVKVGPGDIIGVVEETPLIEHKIMVPPGYRGKISEIVPEGEYTVEEAIATLESNGKKHELKMYHKWPVRKPRPYKVKLEPTEPLITGTRIIDTFFPMAKGGTGAVPGGFGTGKCVLPHTPVLLSDGRLVPIKELFIACKGEEPNPLLDEELVEVENLHVLSFDGVQIVEMPVAYIYKGKTERIIRIKTASGRVIEVTPSHKLITLGERGSFEEKPAALITLGDSIIVPKKIRLNLQYQEIKAESELLGNLSINSSTSNVDGMKVPKIVDEKFAEFLGLLISSGVVDYNSLKLVNEDSSILSRFSSLVKELFGLTCQNVPEGGVGIQKSLLIKLLEELGVSVGRGIDVGVPQIILKSPDRVVAAFLKGYYVGSGRFADGMVEITVLSKKMAGGLSYILARLGVFHEIKKEDKCYKIIIRGLGNLQLFTNVLMESTDFVHRKVEAIREYYMSNPLSPPGNLFGEKGVAMDGGIVIEGSSRTLCFEDLTASATLLNALEYVTLDRVVEVEEIAGEQEVYDLVVPGTQNFVGGIFPAILHNTVLLHVLASWSDARVVIYIGCGERGNEMTEVLVEFPKLKDPWTGRPLMERTILIANTSNMPVAAREASIYTGVTIAEYFRDMGYDVLLVADSTSRWAEALREISGRLEEMPAEEGYPPYLASRLAEFYERAGKVIGVGNPERYGSVTLIGAVSPPGGDFSEPVTSHTKRMIRVFWALDTALAYSRHYPAINWLMSYSAYTETTLMWWVKRVGPEWKRLRETAMEILHREAELREIVRLIGPEALSEHDKLVLEVARMLKDGFLRQNAFDLIDVFSVPEKQYKLLKIIIDFYSMARKAIERGVKTSTLMELPIVTKIVRARMTIPNDKLNELEKIYEEMVNELKKFAEVTL